MLSVTEDQIRQGYLQEFGAATPLASIAESCMRALACAKGRPLRPEEVAHLQARFQCLASNAEDRAAQRISATGFLIRFIDWISPQLQRRWYVRTYGQVFAVNAAVPQPDDNLASAFARPPLPKSMHAPAVASVLPFHTVGLLRSCLVSTSR